MSETLNSRTETDKSKIPLTRSLGLTTGILFVAGAIIGSGVFKKITPMSASLMNRDYILLAWTLAGIITVFGAFTVSGLASTTTESGGIYEYLRLSFGNFFSFLYGWACFFIISGGAIAALAFIFSESVNSVIPLPDPLSRWQHVSIGHLIFPFESSGVKILAVLTIVLLTWINILGTKKGGYLSNIVTAAKIAGIFILIIMGLCFTGNTQTENNLVHTSVQSSNVFSAFVAAMLSAFWAYDGWYSIGYLTGEIKNPKKNIPIAIISGIGICILLYILLNEAFMHVLSLTALSKIDENNIAAVAVARRLAGNAGATGIAVLIAICTFGALNALIISAPRLYYRMAQEKFFPKKAAEVHPLYRTPYKALIYAGLWGCVLVTTGTFDMLTNMVVFAEFIFFGLLGWGLIKMKREGKISARLILYPLSPVVLILFSLTLLINTIIAEPMQSLSGILFMLAGVPVYYYYKRKSNFRKKA